MDTKSISPCPRNLGEVQYHIKDIPVITYDDGSPYEYERDIWFELITDYINELPHTIDVLRHELSVGNLEMARHAAKILQDYSADIGANRIASLSRHIQCVDETYAPYEISVLVKLLESEATEIVHRIKQMTTEPLYTL